MMRSRAGYDNNGKWLHVFFVFSTYLQSVLSQCSGTTLVFTATDTYQVFTSLNYPAGYANDQDCMWRIEADNITDAVRMEITDAAIEFHAGCVYDYGQVFDGYNATADSLGKFCGTDNPSYVSTGSYLTVTFKSDYSLSSEGFKARYKSGPRSSLLDKEEDSSQLNMLAIMGASIGSVVFIVIIIMMIYTYIQAKKAKELRRHPHMHRGMRLARVEPFGYGGEWSYLDGPAPPAYGEIYSSPMSPPPQYSEIDPNPNPCAPLPGRSEFMASNHPIENGSVTNTDPSTIRERTDTNANTHFIMTSNLRGFVAHGNNNTVIRARTPITGGAIVNSSTQILHPASLHTAAAIGNSASINIPGQTDSLPTAVVPLSTENSQGPVITSNSFIVGQNDNISPPTRQNVASTLSTTAQNHLNAEGVVSPSRDIQDREDMCYTVSEMSLPPSPVQGTAQVS